ncbi:MAG: DEAD/DEAH box helicase [Candidatus Anstonellaceae archaeon]
MGFDKLVLNPEIKKALAEIGFSKPTPIQEKSLPLLLQGEDLIGQAQTGTGKTAAFGIAILEKLSSQKIEGNKVRALVLAPTRELALQVSSEISKIGMHLPYRTVAIYGGEDIEKQITILKEGADIVVGTPGRILDHISRGTLSLSSIEILVLDEADRMLDMGFIEDIEKILKSTPESRQTLLFSATMPKEILQLARQYMKAPQEILISEDSLSVKSIKQYYVEVSKFDKLNAFLTLLSQKKPPLALVFVRTKKGADKLNQILQDRGFRSIALHGDMSQSKRNRSMEAFRKSHVNILVATDLASRGLDISGVTHVFNYDLTDDPYTYLHRIGRTGRMGKNGEAISFVFFDQVGLIPIIEKITDSKMEKLNVEIRPELLPKRIGERNPIPERHGSVRITEKGKKRKDKTPKEKFQSTARRAFSRGYNYFGRRS